MTDEEDITFAQDVYCGIMDAIMQRKTAGQFMSTPQKRCRDLFYEVDHGIMDYHEFEMQMKQIYGPVVVEAVSNIMAQINEGTE